MNESESDQPTASPDIGRLADQIEELWDECEACLSCGSRAGAIETLGGLRTLLNELRQAARLQTQHTISAFQTAEILEETSKMLDFHAPKYVRGILNQRAAALRLAFLPPRTVPPLAPEPPFDLDAAAMEAAVEEIERESLVDDWADPDDPKTVRDLVLGGHIQEAEVMNSQRILRNMAETWNPTPLAPTNPVKEIDA